MSIYELLEQRGYVYQCTNLDAVKKYWIQMFRLHFIQESIQQLLRMRMQNGCKLQIGGSDQWGKQNQAHCGLPGINENITAEKCFTPIYNNTKKGMNQHENLRRTASKRLTCTINGP